jgi:hypothetical protein
MAAPASTSRRGSCAFTTSADWWVGEGVAD